MRKLCVTMIKYGNNNCSSDACKGRQSQGNSIASMQDLVFTIMMPGGCCNTTVRWTNFGPKFRKTPDSLWGHKDTVRLAHLWCRLRKRSSEMPFAETITSPIKQRKDINSNFHLHFAVNRQIIQMMLSL